MPSRFERLTGAIHETLADPTVERALGRNGLAKHAQKRRIVWIHAPSSTTDPSQAGGRLVGTDANGTRQRAIWIRLEGAEVHLYAEDEATLDALLDNLLAAISLTIPNTVRSPMPYEWTTDQAGQAGHSLRQPKIVLQLVFRLPVIDEIKPLQPLTGESHECEILSESGP